MIFGTIGVEFREALQGPNPENFRNTAPPNKTGVLFKKVLLISLDKVFRKGQKQKSNYYR